VLALLEGRPPSVAAMPTDRVSVMVSPASLSVRVVMPGGAPGDGLGTRSGLPQIVTPTRR